MAIASGSIPRLLRNDPGMDPCAPLYIQDENSLQYYNFTHFHQTLLSIFDVFLLFHAINLFVCGCLGALPTSVI